MVALVGQNIELNEPLAVNIEMGPKNRRLLDKINRASDIFRLQDLYFRKGAKICADHQLLQAYRLRFGKLDKKMKRELDKLKRQVSTFVAKDGDVDDALTLSNKIKARCPNNTYSQIIVTTLASHEFPDGTKKARKIELIRTNWGLLKVPIFEAFQALFSAAMKEDSIYREVLEHNLIMCGLLASSLIVGDIRNGISPDNKRQAEYEKQMRASYWSGKKIEIIFPADLSESGSLRFINESKILSFSIDGGKFVRSLITDK